MLIVTTNDIPGHRIDAVFGEVMGLTVRSRDIGSQMLAGFRSLGGGELPEMTRALYESRQEVMARMVAEAQQRGANAIVAMRLTPPKWAPTGPRFAPMGQPSLPSRSPKASRAPPDSPSSSPKPARAQRKPARRNLPRVQTCT